MKLLTPPCFIMSALAGAMILKPASATSCGITMTVTADGKVMASSEDRLRRAKTTTECAISSLEMELEPMGCGNANGFNCQNPGQAGNLRDNERVLIEASAGAYGILYQSGSNGDRVRDVSDNRGQMTLLTEETINLDRKLTLEVKETNGNNDRIQRVTFDSLCKAARDMFRDQYNFGTFKMFLDGYSEVQEMPFDIELDTNSGEELFHPVSFAISTRWDPDDKNLGNMVDLLSHFPAEGLSAGQGVDIQSNIPFGLWGDDEEYSVTVDLKGYHGDVHPNESNDDDVEFCRNQITFTARILIGG